LREVITFTYKNTYGFSSFGNWTSCVTFELAILDYNSAEKKVVQRYPRHAK